MTRPINTLDWLLYGGNRWFDQRNGRNAFAIEAMAGLFHHQGLFLIVVRPGFDREAETKPFRLCERVAPGLALKTIKAYESRVDAYRRFARLIRAWADRS